MTDFWPQEGGAVFDACSYILPCYPEGAISEMSSVTINASSAAGRIEVVVSTAIGDGIGIALKEATGTGVPERIPVLFYGIAKCTLSGVSAPAMGQIVWNSITTTVGHMQVATVFACLTWAGGAFRPLGMLMQSLAATGDEGLVLVGKVL